MKNCHLFFKSIVLIMILAFVGILPVYAKAGESIVIDQKTYIQTGLGSRVESKYHTTKGYGWCITPHKIGAPQGTTLYYSRQETDGGILYLLDKAGTSDVDRLKTQLALWIYDSHYLPLIYGQNPNVGYVQEAKQLSNAAIQNKNYKVGPSISVGSGDISISRVKIGDVIYYKTSNMKANVSGASYYYVTLTSSPYGTQIVDESGNVTNKIKRGGSFSIRVPEKNVTKDTTFKLKFSATGVKKYVERYIPANAAQQELIILVSENQTVSATMDVILKVPRRICQVYNGQYYGSNGAIVTEQQYRDQCLKICKIENGKYYGSNGTEVSEQEYRNQCLKICKIENGKYYGKNGTEVSEQEYRNQCLKICKIENGKYYGKNGTEVSEQEYRNQCLKICKIENGKYYGKNGIEVTEQEYRNQCLKICKVENGKYYGKNGTEVSEQEYRNQCLKICKIENGKYYGKNGTEVSEQEYRNQCLKICKIENGKYYGKNGIEVTEQEYRDQCLKICKVENGIYYGTNGTAVTEQEYRSQCMPATTVSVPNTGSHSDPTGIIGGSLLVLGGIGITVGYRMKKES